MLWWPNLERMAPGSVSSRTSRRCAPVPQAASSTRPVRGAPPEAGRLQGMVLLISPRNATWVLRPDSRRPKAAISPRPEAEVAPRRLDVISVPFPAPSGPILRRSKLPLRPYIHPRIARPGRRLRHSDRSASQMALGLDACAAPLPSMDATVAGWKVQDTPFR
jgi:hypothetical protein